MGYHHTITENELNAFVEEQRQKWVRFAGSFGDGSDKALEFMLTNAGPFYRVSDHGRGIYIGALKETAIREYNALP